MATDCRNEEGKPRKHRIDLIIRTAVVRDPYARWRGREES